MDLVLEYIKTHGSQDVDKRSVITLDDTLKHALESNADHVSVQDLYALMKKTNREKMCRLIIDERLTTAHCVRQSTAQ